MIPFFKYSSAFGKCPEANHFASSKNALHKLAHCNNQTFIINNALVILTKFKIVACNSMYRSPQRIYGVPSMLFVDLAGDFIRDVIKSLKTNLHVVG